VVTALLAVLGVLFLAVFCVLWLPGVFLLVGVGLLGLAGLRSENKRKGR
jgi:hypothetical protein